MDDEGFLPNIDPKLAFAKMNPNVFPVDLNTATYYEIVRIPHVGSVAATKIIEARKNMKVQFMADLERIVGANLTYRISEYVELKDKKLTEFSFQ